LSKDTADLVSTMKQIAKSLVNIELHLQAMRPSGVQTHSPTGAIGTAWDTPWRATQRAAWEALRQVSAGRLGRPRSTPTLR
jgi:hypothetical protein